MCVYVIMIKIVMLLVKNVFVVLSDGISKKVGQVVQKHTAKVPVSLEVLSALETMKKKSQHLKR